MRISILVALCGAAVVFVCGCGGDPPAGVDGGTSMDLGDALDLGGIESDARVVCTGDVDCNDGLFCNGREMCAPASASADVRGCVPGDGPCSAGETCDEMTNDCRTSCDDLDGDGHDAVVCGGDDCDDADASRYPGAIEVCDAGDEDCNDATLGFVDADADGAGSAACCNGTACGTDCDDSNASIRPGVADGPTMNCNSIDDDCDGVVDVACPCADGERRACYGGPASARDVGICIDGVSICAGGMLGSECIDDVLPAIEICNDVDDDCDGTTDEGVIPRYYVDVDGDGFGQTAMFIDDRCNPPAGYVAAAGDCNDTLPTIRPGLADFCNGVDDDCDGMTDEGAPQGTYYRDDDGDGYGAAATALMACSAPMGFVPASGDCDDTRAGVSPVGVEVCDAAVPAVDEDCDSMLNEGCACVDGSSQPCGGGTPVQGACRAGVQRCIAGIWAGCAGNVDPGTLTETCNGVDDDCDGMTDESLLAASCFADGDSDGFGAGAALTTLCRDAARTAFGFCPSGYSNVGGDCNDGNSATRPMGTELCDAGNVDDNCNGSNNEGCACANGSVQSCGGGGRVGVGICRSGTQRCVSGAWLPCEGNVEPVAVETCNGLDDNCVGGIDEGVTVTVYVDADGDTYGVGAGIVTCAASAGYAARAGDCNDSNPAVRPGSVETCNGLDDNCNAMIDEALLAASCYADGDSDGYGAGTALTTLCRDGARAAFGSCPVGYTNVAGDCNNAIAAINPAAAESCNGIDDNCAGGIDEGVRNTYFADADGDGYGATGTTTLACSVPAGYSTVGGDCNDASTSIRPSAPEICNGIDENCAGGVDEGVTRAFYRDVDGDGFGVTSMTTQACATPVGYADRGGDCNDAAGAANINPVAFERCDGAVDDDCDGIVDDGCACVTGATRPCGPAEVGICRRGVNECLGATWSTTCTGEVAARVETCNGLDDDCNGAVDNGAGATVPCYADGDSDAYGAGGLSQRCPDPARATFGNCPSGYTNVGGDCNDASGAIRPGVVEVCNGVDDNCATGVDEGLTASGCHVDGDSDGYGAGIASPQCRDLSRGSYGNCPVGYTDNATDCNDANGGVHPLGTESCNGTDDDCDGITDEGVKTTFYVDVDRDGYGLTGSTMLACSVPSGYAVVGGDCNDGNASIRPGAGEICDAIDQNCTAGDEPTRTFYRDADGDLYGTSTLTTIACAPPAGYVEIAGDCNDANSTVRPAATETCDGLDNDCDTPLTIDEAPAAANCAGTYPTATGVQAWSCLSGPARCGIATCQAGRGDCDGILFNGCETDTTSSALNCGMCGTTCGVGGLCSSGACDQVLRVFAGDDNTCITRGSGSLVCWGDGRLGQTVDATLPTASYPTVIPGLVDVDVVEPGYHVCAANPGPTGNLFCWGSNVNGEIGNGTTVGPVIAPTISAVDACYMFVAGGRHTCLYREGRFAPEIQCWGDNAFGQLGVPPIGTDLWMRGTRVLGLPSTTITSMCAGRNHSCAVSGGQVWCWGEDITGQLGNGGAVGDPNTATPVRAGTFTSATQVSCDGQGTCALQGGLAYCWGFNGGGEVGDGTTIARVAPVAVLGGLSFVELASGGAFVCGRTAAGRVYCWGYNDSGQLGSGTIGVNSLTPRQISPATTLATHITAGAAHACMRLSTGDIYCWGRGSSGQLGNGASANTVTPMLVPGL